jgi:hypothetical protein
MARYGINEDPDPLGGIYQRSGLNSARIRELDMRKYVGVRMNPVFLNGWFTNIAGETPYTYCLLLNFLLHHEGTIDGGASGSIAYVLPPLWRPRRGNIHLPGHVLGATVAGARFDVNAATGEVTVVF